MSKSLITRGERLKLIGYLTAPVLFMVAAIYFDDGKVSNWMATDLKIPAWVMVRFSIAVTIAMCWLFCTARAEILAGLVVPVGKWSLLALTCWAVLAFSVPQYVCGITMYVAFKFWFLSCIRMGFEVLDGRRITQ